MEIQKLEYLKKEKRFLDKIKYIFHSFWRAIIWLKIKIWSKIVDTSFNARSSSWWKNDKTTVEGARLEALTSSHGFHQLISEPTHLLPTSTSCTDLIFTDQSNLVADSGTHSTLNPKCHHQITYCKLNLNIKYPPPYQRLVWDYKRANVESIKMSIELVNWETLFHNKTVHKQVSIFNETLMNIFSNFIPNKYITFDDRDPPWMNDFVKTKTKFKNQLYNTYIKMVIKTRIIICFMKQ